jgi:hypothetical protein
MFERYVEFSVNHKPEHHLVEQTFISSGLGFAGTIDRVCTIDGKTYVLDIKTSNGIYNSYWLQLAAYRQLYDASVLHGSNMPDIDGVAILWLNAKTRTSGKKGDVQGKGWQMVSEFDTSKQWSLFQAVQQLWHAEHEGDKPKEFSYQLSHKK